MSHVSPHEFAAFVDAMCDADTHRRIREHVDRCPECLAAYHDAVLALGTARNDEITRLPADVAARALAAGARNRPHGARVRRHRLWAVGAAFVILVGAVLLVRGVRDNDRWDPLTSDIAPIAESVIAQGGTLLFPGTEAYVPASPTTYRSTRSPENPEATELLRRQMERFTRGETTVDESYWLAAGYAARDEDGFAREVIEVCRARSRDDPRFFVIEGILAYRNSDLSAARQSLMAAVVSVPRSSEAHYNLSVVLEELGELELARRHLALAQALAKGPMIHARRL